VDERASLCRAEINAWNCSLDPIMDELMRGGGGCPIMLIVRYFRINLLASEFYVSILAHPVCKMLITQEPKKLALRNERHFEEKNGECAAC
jgi:hypothetical protein